MSVEIGDGRRRMSKLAGKLIPKGESLEVELQCVVYNDLGCKHTIVIRMES